LLTEFTGKTKKGGANSDGVLRLGMWLANVAAPIIFHILIGSVSLDEVFPGATLVDRGFAPWTHVYFRLVLGSSPP
jgi:hypothetical protein